MKLVTWNVNSLKVRLPHVLEWLAEHQPDVLCLQETKQEDVNFPASELAAAGYQTVFSGQKTYNGVAILSKTPATDIVTAIPGYLDPQKRVLAATIADTRIINLYIPNGQSLDSGKYQYKLSWLEALTDWLKGELARHPRLAMLGDFNIAPEEIDVYDPKAWEGQVLFSPPEREAFRKWIGMGLIDSFRLFEQAEKSYSWWDYRMNALRRNMGCRIDHILLSSALAETCTACGIDKEARKAERPSDHAPVMAEF